MTFEELKRKLANPTRRALENAGIFSLEDLASYSKKEVAKLHGIGRNALETMESGLQESGLHFKENG